MGRRKKAMIEALERRLGVVTLACKDIGVGRETHYRWIREDAQYAAAVEELGQMCLDFAESALFAQMKGGVPASTIFYLKTKGRDRGYIEKRDVDVTSGGRPLPAHPPITWTDEEGSGE